MRPIPFEVVFVTGLGEKNFPRSDVRSPLDLRWAPELKPRRGDAVSARAQDEYMFLETLISTRERLFLSYVARDSQTGEELEPSSVLRQLTFMLEQNYVTEDVLESMQVAHPLRRWDVDYFDDPESGGIVHHPEALDEAQMVRLRESLRAHCRAADVDEPTLRELGEFVSGDDHRRLREKLLLPDVPESAAPDDELERFEVTVSQIRKFLESPLQGSATFFLRLRQDREEDVFARKDEAFETTGLDAHRILSKVFLRHVESRATDTPRPLPWLYQDVTRRLELLGTSPTGPFRDAERDKHLELMELWSRNLSAMGIGESSPMEVVAFGDAGDDSVVTSVVEPLEFRLPLENEDGVRDVLIEVTGRTGAFFPKEWTSLRLTRSSWIGSNGNAETKFLRGFVDYVLLMASGQLHARRNDAESLQWRVFVDARTAARADRHVRMFDPFTQTEARSYLATILADMVGSMHAYLMPAEAVFDFTLAEGAPPPFERIVDDKRDDWYCQFQFGPIRHPERFEPPPDFETLIARRFEPYLTRRVAP